MLYSFFVHQFATFVFLRVECYANLQLPGTHCLEYLSRALFLYSIRAPIFFRAQYDIFSETAPLNYTYFPYDLSVKKYGGNTMQFRAWDGIPIISRRWAIQPANSTENMFKRTGPLS